FQQFGHRRTGLSRGVRYQWVLQAMEAVRADAGFMLCGLSLVHAEVARGSLLMPFGTQEGCWAKHPFEARFRPVSLKRSALAHFRDWLLAEARATDEALSRTVES
ncbi:MAG: hypothetical protein AAGJ36_07580, partial [Pseudomonadota bacterium]